MTQIIQHIVEARRGCGYKKPGGTYLIGGKFSSPCCKLPFELFTCYCCGQGIKFSRGFTWINSDLFAAKKCSGNFTPSYGRYSEGPDGCIQYNASPPCILSEKGERLGLMWVGEAHYQTPGKFIAEAAAIGISKRIGIVPKDCVPGSTWIALAHKKGIIKGVEIGAEGSKPGNTSFVFVPAIFMVFLLEKIQYVVTGNESDEELQKKVDRGIELIQVQPEGEQIKML